jgi:hypothetical protein
VQVVRALLAAADGREGRLLPVARHLQALWRADPALSHMEVYAPELVALLLLGPPQYAVPVGEREIELVCGVRVYTYVPLSFSFSFSFSLSLCVRALTGEE